MQEISAKAIMLGEASVGKSSIIKRYFDNSFDEHIPNTIGTAFLTKVFESEDKSRALKFNVWDTCGQERFMAIASIYYRDANVILLTIDADNEKSLDTADKYYEEIKNNAVSNPFIVLVVSKVDLLPRFNSATEIGPDLYASCPFYDKIKKFMAARSLEEIFWTSAKEGINVSKLFDFIAHSILNGKIHIAGEGKSSTKRILAHSIVKNPQRARQDKGGCC